MVTDVSDYRLELAKAAGADLTVNVSRTTLAEAQRELGMREGFDIGLEMSGSPLAMAEMLTNLNHGARVAMLGLPKDSYPIDWGKVITHMITIKGIYGRDVRHLVCHERDAGNVGDAARRRALGHHPPLPRRAVAGRLCRGAIRPVRQGRPGLELRFPCPGRDPALVDSGTQRY